MLDLALPDVLTLVERLVECTGARIDEDGCLELTTPGDTVDLLVARTGQRVR